MMFYNFCQFGWLGAILNLIFVVGLTALIVLLVISALRKSGAGASPGTSTNQAGSSVLDILQGRYARGEISREDYQQIKTDLGF